MQPRRAQQPITIRSDKAAAKLAVLTRNGRSQAEVIEEALELVPEPAVNGIAERMARLAVLLDRIDPAGVPTMAEFDAATYDDHGLPR